MIDPTGDGDVLRLPGIGRLRLRKTADFFLRRRKRRMPIAAMLAMVGGALAFTSPAFAHFVFIIPAADETSARVILSESLHPDEQIDPRAVAGAKLTITDSAGHDTVEVLKPGEKIKPKLPDPLVEVPDAKGRPQKVVMTPGGEPMSVDVPGKGTRVIHGVAENGIQADDSAKPFLLVYYPKAIVGNPFDPKTKIGDAVPVELVPTGEAGKLKIQLLADGKAVSSAEVTVIPPTGEVEKMQTDANGEVGPFNAPGRYGVWARHFTSAGGDRDGKHFDATHEYATLVIDAPAVVSKTAIPPMPQKASSFGAVACDGWLYVYGGHTADTHDYSDKTVSGEFHRINLSDPKHWEPLPGGPKLQGLNLAAYHGKIYRVGGMSPHNKDDQTEDVRSVADCAVYDPATKAWTPLPPMPQARSSHDVAVVGDQLVVVGGWTLTGDSDEAKWLDTALVMDLSAATPGWKTVKQPFQRRALIAAAFDGKVYVLGGFLTESDPTLAVDIYDPKADSWTKGPPLPGPEINGFGPAACTLDGTLYVSVANGSLFALNKSEDGWGRITRTTPRIVHRMVPDGENVVILGGASGQKQTDLVETAAVKPR